MVKVAGRMDLFCDALDILDECHFLLKFLKILWDGIGLHYMGSWHRLRRPSPDPYALRSVHTIHVTTRTLSSD